MPWEFRRPALGGAVVEAQHDPFASPRWVPPVWRMPVRLVLLVGLFRAAARGVRFVIRHPVVVAVVSVLVLLGWRFGWLVPVALAGLVGVALGVWVLFDRGSFARWVWWPTVARVRWVFVYRRHWQPVMITAGLARSHQGREYLPVLRRVVSAPAADRVLVKMLTGQAPDAWGNATFNLAHGFGVQLVRVRSGPRPGWIWLECVRRDVLTAPIPALPISCTARLVDLGGLVVGRCEDGTPWRLRLHGTHVLVVGVTGAGKASVIWSAVRALLPAMRAGLVRVWAVDPKRMELSYGRRLFGRYADTPADMVALLEDAVTEMHARAAAYAGRVRTHTPTAGHPFLLIVVDEVAFLTAYLPDRELRKRAEQALATLTTQGRSVGVSVMAVLQDPRKEVLNLRNLFPDKIALRLDEPEQVDMVLGAGARDRGAFCDLISPATPGVGYVRLETTPDPVRVRAAYVTDEDIRAMADQYGREQVAEVRASGAAA